MTPKVLCVFVLIAVVALLAGPAMAAERMNDKAVEQQGKQIKEGFEIWKKALEKKKFEDAVIRGAAGTIDVREYLKSFAKDIDTFNDRFKDTKSAGTDALALLRRASDVERRVRQQGGISTPAEWAALSTQCKALAAAYGAVFPLESMDATANRLSDKELIERLDEMGRLAKRVKGPVDDLAKKTAGMDKSARETMKLEFDSIDRLAGEVADRLRKGEPASVQVSQLLAVTGSAQGKLAALDLPQTAKHDWSLVDHAAAEVAHAFGELWTSR